MSQKSSDEVWNELIELIAKRLSAEIDRDLPSREYLEAESREFNAGLNAGLDHAVRKILDMRQYPDPDAL